MLALLWATRYIRCYLYGKGFLVRTDHAALTYLRKFADHNSHLSKTVGIGLSSGAQRRVYDRPRRRSEPARGSHHETRTPKSIVSNRNKERMLSVADKTQGLITVRVNSSWIR